MRIFWFARGHQRQGHIVLRGKFRKQVMRLKHKPNVARANAVGGAFADTIHTFACHGNGTTCGAK